MANQHGREMSSYEVPCDHPPIYTRMLVCGCVKCDQCDEIIEMDDECKIEPDTEVEIIA